MKKYFFLSALIVSFFSVFQGSSQAITISVSPSPATVNQPVTIIVNSSYTVFAATPNCTLQVDFGDGSPLTTLSTCTTNSCTRTTSHTYTTPGQYTITARSLTGACISPPTAPNPATASLTVRCAALAISSPSFLPPGTGGAPYSYQIQAAGGEAPYGFSITSGTLPPGLGLTASGLISGTPTASGFFNFTVNVNDSCPLGTQTQSQSFSLTIACPQIGITSPAVLTPASVGQNYIQQILASGGQPPLTFSLSAGSLPPGLTMSASGLISGIPTTVGTNNFTITAADTCTIQTQSVQKAFSITVSLTPCQALNITSVSPLPPGTTGQPYSQQILTTGGQLPLTFSIASGSLPAGITLSPSGLISGTPIAAGNSSFMVKVDDNCPSGIQTQRQPFSLAIGCPPFSITSSSVLPPGTAGTPYAQQISTAGGQSPVSFSIASGTLPPGLALSASGLVSGTPAAPGTFNFTITAADSCTAGIQQDQRAFSMVVGGDLRVTVSPMSFRIPRNMVSSQNIVYTFSNTSAAATTLTSNRGVFTANAQVVGESLTPMTISLVNGMGAITEVLNVPAAVTLRAEQAGTSRIIYTRTFTSGALSVTAQSELIAGAETTAEFSIHRLQLYFENRRAEITVGRNQPGLKAFADIRFSGSGLLNGYWEVDGRILEYVNQHLVYGTTLTLATPDVPSLPTFAPGTHMVRFVVTAPAEDIPIPQALYFVTSEESGEVRAIELTFPEDQVRIPYDSVLFEWQPMAWANTYLVVFFADSDEKPIFSAYTREGAYRLPSMILSSLFSKDKTFSWQVKGYDAEGNVLGASAVYRFVFSD